jgi:hypothetical protein
MNSIKIHFIFISILISLKLQYAMCLHFFCAKLECGSYGLLYSWLIGIDSQCGGFWDEA